jgi:hypothetical protein
LFVPTDSWFIAFENVGHRTMFKHGKCCIWLNKSPSETLRMLKEARGKAAMERKQVWVARMFP